MTADRIETPSSSSSLFWPLVVAAAWGGFMGILHIIGLRTERLATGVRNPDVMGNPNFVVGQLGLYAAPIFLGIIAGLAWPGRPVRKALLLCFLCDVAALPLLGEGLVCMIVILPLSLLLSVVSAELAALCSSRRGAKLLLLLPFALALTQRLDPPGLPPAETMTDSVVVHASPEEVWRSIDRLHMHFLRPHPWLEHVGVPIPLELEGSGAHVGAERRVAFSNGVVLARVAEAKAPGWFAVQLTVERSGREFFDHWAVLGRSTFQIDALPDGHARITHSTTYRPSSLPRWYFAPVERLFGRAIQRYMLQAYADQVLSEDSPGRGPFLARR